MYYINKSGKTLLRLYQEKMRRLISLKSGRKYRTLLHTLQENKNRMKQNTMNNCISINHMTQIKQTNCQEYINNHN